MYFSPVSSANSPVLFGKHGTKHKKAPSQSRDALERTFGKGSNQIQGLSALRALNSGALPGSTQPEDSLPLSLAEIQAQCQPLSLDSTFNSGKQRKNLQSAVDALLELGLIRKIRTVFPVSDTKSVDNEGNETHRVVQELLPPCYQLTDKGLEALQ
jgi:hypothetical protein